MMTECRECQKQVSTKAEICPHCGIRDPWRPKSGLRQPVHAIWAIAFSICIIAVFTVIAVLDLRTGKPKAKPLAQKQMTTDKKFPMNSTKSDISKWAEAPVPEAEYLPESLRPVVALLFSGNVNYSPASFAGLEFDSSGRAHFKESFRKSILSKYGSAQAGTELRSLADFQCINSKGKRPFRWIALGSLLSLGPQDREIAEELAREILSHEDYRKELESTPCLPLVSSFYEASDNSGMLGGLLKETKAWRLHVYLLSRYPLQSLNELRNVDLPVKAEILSTAACDGFFFNSREELRLKCPQFLWTQKKDKMSVQGDRNEREERRAS